MFFIKTFALFLGTLSWVNVAEYTLSQDYTGANFLDGFNFFTGADPTNGHVVLVDEITANDTSLAGFIAGGNSTGSVYLGVDYTNVAPQGRPALRLTSTQTYNLGLFILDLDHMPGGVCGTWPAFWMLGTAAPWPTAGEIDIVEGVNSQSSNKMTLHTNAGVTVQNSSSSGDVVVTDIYSGNSSTPSPLFTGTLVTSNCDVNAPGQDVNAGCLIADQPSSRSFGQAFNAHGGGVFATEWTDSEIKIWFFPRDAIPQDIMSGRPVPPPSSSSSSSSSSPSNSTWGTPNALLTTTASSSSSFPSHFQDMQLIFDTTFCGDWASRVWSTDPQCASLTPTCEQFVSDNPSAFEEAYWALRGLKVYQNPQLEENNNNNNNNSAPLLPVVVARDHHGVGMRRRIRRKLRVVR